MGDPARRGPRKSCMSHGISPHGTPSDLMGIQDPRICICIVRGLGCLWRIVRLALLAEAGAIRPPAEAGESCVCTACRSWRHQAACRSWRIVRLAPCDTIPCETKCGRTRQTNKLRFETSFEILHQSSSNSGSVLRRLTRGGWPFA